MNFKSGFIAIVGRPNVGKSTFVNYVLGRKISIISPKPQTTRNNIRGIYTDQEAQMIFIDTPGIHKPRHELGSYMNKQAINTLADVDLILLIVDATQDFGTGDSYVISSLEKVDTPCFLIMNKIDLIKNKGKLIENVEAFHKQFSFTETYYISSLQGSNIDKLLDGIKTYLEPGPMYYPKDQVTDNPETFIIQEVIREKILLLTEQEVPHSISVVIELMKRDEKGLLNIHAVIYVERQSQKKIIIGQKGNMIKKIGTLARKEIVMILGERIFLELWVKVEPDWRNKKTQLRKMGYDLEN
ncbi:MAG TPA: GTPase Era [Acholeplasmataceae bacterium]|nr:GTPase Era [Acholeplasmataceae bacterium]